MEKWYLRMTADKIKEIQLNLKQELKVESENFENRSYYNKEDLLTECLKSTRRRYTEK